MTIIQLIGLMLLAALIIVICKTSYSFYKFKKAFPVEARFINLKQQYADLIVDLEAAIENTDSVNELNLALNAIDYPPETILVVIQRENPNERERKYARDSAIIDRLNPPIKNGSNYTNNIVWNGGGYGQNNDQHYYILQHKLAKYDFEYIEVKLERDRTELAVA